MKIEVIAWEALAATFTGLAGLWGALHIGGRQNKILTRQEKADAERLRMEQLEFRYPVYETARKWTRYIWTHGKAPTCDLHSEFVRAIDDAKLRCSPPVSQTLSEWLTVAQQHRVCVSHGERKEASRLWLEMFEEIQKIDAVFEADMRA